MCMDSTFYMGIKTKPVYPVDMYSHDLSIKDNINSTTDKIKLRSKTPGGRIIDLIEVNC